MKRRFTHIYIPFLIGLLGLGFMSSCDKNLYTKDGKLRYSADTVLFDTSFTQVGSLTRRIVVKNTNARDIRINKVYLEKGHQSAFRINVDGFSGPLVEEIDVLSGDSVFIFIESTIDPTGSTGQLFEDDHIVVDYANGPDKLYLAGPGSDAIYYFPNDTLQDNLGRKYPVRILQGNHEWVEGKPVVIVGTLVMDAGAVLTMHPGTRVHMFNGAMLWIYKGATLKILGERNRKVVIEGTRLGSAYAQLAGQWDRIWINEGSTEHEIRNAIIKNGRLGIQAGGLDMSDGFTPRYLKIENTSIYNMSNSCLLAMNYEVEAKNLFINNFNNYGIALVLGGKYKFNHITVAGYQSGTRPSAGFYFSNTYAEYIAAMQLNVENSILYGNNPTELGYDQISGTAFDYMFRNCLIKIDPKIDTENSFYPGLIKNKDPRFYAPYFYDPSLLHDSPARDSADISYSNANMFDYHGKNRLIDGRPDIGCAEYKGD